MSACSFTVLTRLEAAQAVSNAWQRRQSMELLGSHHLGPPLFVDDVVASFASDEEVTRAVDAGLGEFASLVKACFNMGPTKTAIMACLDANAPSRRQVACENYKLLGIQIDRDLSFRDRLGYLLRVGRALFSKLFLLLKHTGFSPPVLAAAVTERIEPVVLYGAEILPLIPDSYKQLHALQADWARAILTNQTGRATHGLRGALAVAQVGWLQRLSTKALSKTAMYMAKVSLLPVAHPVVRMLMVAKNMPDGTWWHAAKTTLANHGFVCPSLIESEIAPPEILEVARHDKAARRNVLCKYKLTVVQPRALARDDREFDMAAQKDLLGFQLAVQHVFPNRVCLAWEGADAHLAASDWECLRWWAVVRMTACWPCQMCGGTSSVDLLDECPLCGEVHVQVDVAHCLHVCPGTESLFNVPRQFHVEAD